MLSRRDFIIASGGLIVGMTPIGNLLAHAVDKPLYAGWVPSREETINFKTRQRMPMFSQVAKNLYGSGKGKKALLWRFFEKASNGKFVPHDQEIGDCVAQSWALGIDFLNSIQIARGKGRWTGKVATEVIYSGGRVEVGKGAISGAGLHGSWAGRWCRDYGVLLRQPYLNGKYNFTTYSGAKARRWAHICRRCTPWGGGVPDELEPLCKKHPLKTIKLITSWPEARDAVYNGYPVVICSDYGFSSQRDGEGFADKRGTWYHCLLMAGMDDSYSRPGGLLINSWGPDWINGPVRLDQPLGSFWADADVIDGMLSQEDSFAMSNYIGYPRQNLDYRLY